MKHPNRMGPPEENWLVLTDDGPEFFDDEDEAKEEARKAIEDYVLEGETESAENVLVARVVAYTQHRDDAEDDSQEESDDEDDFIPDDADVYDYELIDIADDTPIARSH